MLCPGDYEITTSQSYDPVIAAVPVMALLALAAFLSIYLIRWAGGTEEGPHTGEGVLRAEAPCLARPASKAPTLPRLPGCQSPTLEHAVLLCLRCRHKALFVSGRRAAAVAAAAGSPADAGTMPAQRRPSDPVQLLTFDSLSCTVPVRHSRNWRRFLRHREAFPPKAAVAEAGATVDVIAAPPAPEKQIVKSVSGAAACGELVGVLGPSGGANPQR